MPTRKPKLSKEGQRKFRSLILRLQAAGVATGTSGGLLSVPKRLDLWQEEYVFSRVHDLPGEQVAVILRCELMALRAGATVRDCVISLPWGQELEQCDPADIPCYDNLIQGWPEWPPTILNRWLTGEVSLPRGKKLTGIIIAIGWTSVPAEYPGESLVNIEVVLSDDQGYPLELIFKAGVDRRRKREYERRELERRKVAASTKRVPIFQRGDTESRGPDRTIQQQGGGPISPSPVVVSAEKSMKGSSPDVARKEMDEPMGAA